MFYPTLILASGYENMRLGESIPYTDVGAYLHLHFSTNEKSLPPRM
jgi:hypothetical protein